MSQVASVRPFSAVPASVGPWLLALGAVWFLAVLGLGLAEAFATPAGSLPWALLLAVLTPVALFGALYSAVPAVRSFVLGLDVRWLVLIHTWRFVGLMFLVLYSYGVLPLVFAAPAGIGDALAAAGALVLSAALFSARGASRRAVLAWNTFGVVDFVVAVSTGGLAGTLLAEWSPVSTDVMAVFPLVLIPGFLVPLFTITHLVIYAQLRTRWRGATRIIV
jgi:hypothetical protein